MPKDGNISHGAVSDLPMREAARLTAEAISSQRFSKDWSNYHKSRTRQNRNPIPQTTAHLKSFAEGVDLTAEERATLLFFASEFLKAYGKALGEPKKSEDTKISNLRQLLKNAAYAARQGAVAAAAEQWGHSSTGEKAGMAMSAYLDIGIDNGHYRKMLSVAQKSTFTKPVEPVRATVDFGAHIVEEAWDALKHPWKRLVLLTTTASTAWLGYRFHQAIGNTDQRVDPTTKDWGPENIGAAADPNAILGDLACHNHIAQLLEILPGVDKATAQSIVMNDIPQGLSDSIAKHCPQWANVESSGLSLIRAAYRMYKDTVFDTAVTDQGRSLGSLMTDSPFARTYAEYLEKFSYYIYDINMIENAILHPIFYTIGFVATMAAASANNTQRQAVKDYVTDFFHRAIRSRPLQYAFGVAAGTATWAIAGEFNSAVILSGAGGFIAGNVLQNLWTKLAKNKDRVLDIMKNATVDHRALAQNEVIKAAIPESWAKLSNTFNIAKGLGKIGAGVSLAAYAGLAFANMHGLIDDNSHQLLVDLSEFAGGTTALGVLTFFFAPYNIFEDSAQHLVFTSAGIATAAPLTPFAALWKKYYNKDKDVPDLPDDEQPMHFHITGEASGHCDFEGCKHDDTTRRSLSSYGLPKTLQRPDDGFITPNF